MCRTAPGAARRVAVECEAGACSAATLGLARRSRRCVVSERGGIERLVVIVIIIISLFPPALLGFQEALVRQVRDLEELLGSSEFAWVRYLRVCTHSFPFPFPHFLSPPQPLPPFTQFSSPRSLDVCLSGCRSAWAGAMVFQQASSARYSTGGK